jgi:stage III sporulation protein AA
LEAKGKWVEDFDAVALYTGGSLREYLLALPPGFKSLVEEIRIRSGADVQFTLSAEPAAPAPPCKIKKEDVETAFELMCKSSVYSFSNEIRNGFVTIRGGHRAGICGTAVVKEGQVSTLKDISSINFRITKEVPGAADPVMPHAVSGGQVKNALIVSPPGCGKTNHAAVIL